MMRMSRTSRWLVGIAALVAGTLVPAVHAEGAGTVVTQAVFNNPTGTAAQQDAIQDKVVELINGAAQGSTIRVSQFYAHDPTIPNALVEAHSRGVNVQAMFDYSTRKNYPDVYKTMSDAIGNDPSAASFVSTCPQNRGCIGTRKLGTVYALNHNKFYLFSSTLGTPNVVVQASANLNAGRDGTKGWNNALVLTGHDDIYTSYNDYFTDQIAAKPDNNYYDTRVPVTQDNAKIHFFPRREASGTSPYNDPSEDPIATLLDHVACTGNNQVGTPGDHRTEIWVNMNIFSRPYLADRLVKLDAAGCYVEVVLNHDPSNALAVQSLNTLLAKTSSAYNGVGVAYYCKADTLWTHSKYIVVEGKYYGVPDRKIVWTGSANFSTNSLRQADETLLQYENSGIADGYHANARTAFDAATHKPANGDAIAC